MAEFRTFSTKIDTWESPIIMRAYDKEDAEALAHVLFKVPTDVKVVATEEIVVDKVFHKEYREGG